MKQLIAVIALGTVITACGTPPQKRDIKIVHNVKDESAASHVTSSQGAIINTTNPELREAMEKGAIQGPGGLYFMPIGRDSGGCPYYTSFAPGRVTLTAVYYRRRDGSFTNARNEADCS